MEENENEVNLDTEEQENSDDTDIHSLLLEERIAQLEEENRLKTAKIRELEKKKGLILNAVKKQTMSETNTENKSQIEKQLEELKSSLSDIQSERAEKVIDSTLDSLIQINDDIKNVNRTAIKNYVRATGATVENAVSELYPNLTVDKEAPADSDRATANRKKDTSKDDEIQQAIAKANGY